jgi:hypothetical protein
LRIAADALSSAKIGMAQNSNFPQAAEPRCAHTAGHLGDAPARTADRAALGDKEM